MKLSGPGSGDYRKLGDEFVPLKGVGNVITGAHVVLFTRDAKADRTFLRDILGFPQSTRVRAGSSFDYLRLRSPSILWRQLLTQTRHRLGTREQNST